MEFAKSSFSLSTVTLSGCNDLMSRDTSIRVESIYPLPEHERLWDAKRPPPAELNLPCCFTMFSTHSITAAISRIPALSFSRIAARSRKVMSR